MHLVTGAGQFHHNTKSAVHAHVRWLCSEKPWPITLQVLLKGTDSKGCAYFVSTRATCSFLHANMDPPDSVGSDGSVWWHYWTTYGPDMDWEGPAPAMPEDASEGTSVGMDTAHFMQSTSLGGTTASNETDLTENTEYAFFNPSRKRLDYD